MQRLDLIHFQSSRILFYSTLLRLIGNQKFYYGLHTKTACDMSPRAWRTFR